MTTAPRPGTPRDYRFPATHRETLSSGTRVVIAPISRVPLVTATAVFHGAGADEDHAGREGLAELAASLLLEGTERRDGAAIADQLESFGSSLASAADWDGATVSFTAQTARVGAVADTMREVLQAAAMPARHLARLQAEHAAGRLQMAADPRGLADAAFAWSCYADGARFRRGLDGTTSTVQQITRDDVVGFWRARYVPARLTLVLVGDIAIDAALPIAESLVSGWTAHAAAVRGDDVRARHAAARVTLVEKPGAAQAELRVGHIGVSRAHPDYFRLTVMNAVLGGLFSSRINLNLRERHGFTYGAFSGFDWRRRPGPWGVSSAVKSEACGAALREVLLEIERIRSEEITRDELELAVHYLVGVFPLRFETTTAVAAALASQAAFGLPDDYFDTYRDLMSAVTPRDVLEAARMHLAPDRLQTVVVGDPALVRDDLESFAPDPLILRTPEQVESAP